MTDWHAAAAPHPPPLCGNCRLARLGGWTNGRDGQSLPIVACPYLKGLAFPNHQPCIHHRPMSSNRVDLEHLPTFVCAKCGKEYRIPASSSSRTTRASEYTVLGGRKVCAACAARRFPRRRDEWGMNPDAIGRGME